jgi:hypothetical protein
MKPHVDEPVAQPVGAGPKVDDRLLPPVLPYGHDARVAAVRKVATIMLCHLPGLSARSAGEIWTREPEFCQHFPGPEDLYASCRVSLGAALDSLVRGELDPYQADQVRGLGRRSSQQDIPLEVVLRALRVDFLVLWSEMLLVARTTDPTTLQSLINASDIVWGAVDAVTVEMTVGYRSNQGARARAEALRREAMVARLIDGEHVDSRDVAEVLGLASTDEMLAVVVDSVHGPAGSDDLARAVRYASMHSVWSSRNDTVVGLVALRAERPESLARALSRIDPLRAGTSRTFRGYADIPRAVEEATLALASIRAGRSEVATIFTHPTAVLVAAQPELTAALAEAFLEPLLGRPARERDMLLETLVAFDDADGSVPVVAERLFCHRNTVLNRLAKISRLTGLSFTSPTDLASVALAAEVVRSGRLPQHSTPSGAER